jgi:hypothetical protein
MPDQILVPHAHPLLVENNVVPIGSQGLQGRQQMGLWLAGEAVSEALLRDPKLDLEDAVQIAIRIYLRHMHRTDPAAEDEPITYLLFDYAKHYPAGGMHDCRAAILAADDNQARQLAYEIGQEIGLEADNVELIKVTIGGWEDVGIGLGG